jgi:hypothetical protein
MFIRIPVTLIFLTAVLVACNTGQQSKHQVEKVVIHFMQWDLESYRAMSCDDIRSSPDSVVITESSEIGKLIDAVARSKPEQLISRESIDARICCFFFTRDRQVYRNISFGTGSAMQFDGVVYQLDVDLLKFIAGYLPAGYRAI